ncbi:MAG: stage II sporulation protein M [Chitinophagales bacterium]|nr:stage II sporulation protein M [Chitinophagales bacterium]
MRESNFIRQNRDKWKEFEEILNHEKKDPEKLGNLFVQITDDLSFSRTFYPNRFVRVYLNNLAQRTFLSIYKNKKEKRGRFFLFWKEELPLLIYASRVEFLLSFCVFLLSFCIGVFSGMHDPGFAASILGDSYVNMTVENIRSGDPMKVYKESNGMDMFLGITFNNLKVAFMTYLFGILYAAGTLAILLYNGIMVGTFQYFFIEHHVFRESFLAIWMHGTLEISCIIIAGAAGLVLGKGLVFPGTYSRLQSLQLSARRSLKIMTGIAPIIVSAAIIESFFTRYTDAPDIIRLCVILLSLCFMLLYFVWYPFQKSRSNALPVEAQSPVISEQMPDFTIIRNNGEIFGDLFIFFRKYFRNILLLNVSLAAVATMLLWIINPDDWRNDYLFGAWSFLRAGAYFHHHSLIVYGCNTLMFAINGTVVYAWLIREAGRTAQRSATTYLSFFRQHFIKVCIISATVNAIFLLPDIMTWLLFPLLFPLLLLWLFTTIHQQANPVAAFHHIRRFMGESLFSIYGLFAMLTLVSFILYFFIDSPVIWFFVNVFKWNVLLEQETVNLVYDFILRFVTLFSINFLLFISLAGFGLQYFSLKEIHDAANLKHRITLIGSKTTKA